MLFDAIEFATRAHRGQLRKGSAVPYIVHPLSVMRILLTHGASEILGAAGVLHDTLEDTRTTPAEIEQRFGGDVLRLVDSASEPDKSAPWEERKRHTLHALESAPDDELLLSLADKLDNAESIADDVAREGQGVWTRFKRGRESQAWYYGSLFQVFDRRMQHPEHRRLVERMRMAMGRATLL